ncbi:MAG TPA: glycoside hydrolase family 2 [Candidatus Fimivicinus intestinavium]|nr:glycoside hydrolase family 2 [Candidatus Fimivicinus intestinavium]
MEKIRTRFAADVNAAHVLPEYPRPQLVREGWMNLNGLYDYAITPSGAQCPSAYDGTILVPYCIESALSGVGRPLQPDERLWYHRTFTLDEAFQGKQVLLHFGAVDWQCKVWVNGQLAGTHTGGYCPFYFDITAFLHARDNELTICVYDPTDEGWQQRGKQVLKTHGFWYTATSGIWQTVWAEAVDPCHIQEAKATPDIDRGLFTLRTKLSREEGCQLKISVFDGERQIVSKEISTVAEIELPDAKLWSPEDPFLYDIQLELSVDGRVCDTVRTYVGMRKCSIGKDAQGIPRLMLNNRPYFQRGLLDQGYWCESLLTPPTDEAMIYDIETAKRLGFNMLRKHIKVEPARWYYHCDRLGMLVWQDMISGGAYIGDWTAGVLPNLGIKIKDDDYKRFSRGEKKAREDYRRELFEMIDALECFPSIYCWVPFNEGWGQFDAKQIGDEVKQRDPSRIVDHASGWYDQGGGELNSMHKYVLPVRLPKLDDRPFALTEFGGYSRIIDGHVWDRKKCFGYRMFANEEKLTKAYRRLLEKQVIPLIPKGLSATVYTQVSDVENEVNGIMTYDRAIIKLEENTLRELNAKMTY